MTFEVSILGSNSAVPAHGRHPTSQVLNHNEFFFLIDCGEGTQMQMSKYKVKRSKINHIFISHLHGDHYYGLIGLVTSYHLLQRTEPLTIFCPRGLEEIINLNFKFSDTRLKFKLNFVELNTESTDVIFENEHLAVSIIPMKHRIPCCGFLFKEKKSKRKVIGEKIIELKIPVSEIEDLKSGKDIILEGKKILNKDLTMNALSPRIYAFCSDTLYNEEIISYIMGADLLYHETTFMNESLERASLTFHSTTSQAATIAKKAQVKKLMIGHYSAKYQDLNLLAEEARAIFPNSFPAIEGEKYSIQNTI